jgi:hypothetical protein
VRIGASLNVFVSFLVNGSRTISQVVPVYAVMADNGRRGIASPVSTLGEGEWSTSHNGRFTFGENIPPPPLPREYEAYKPLMVSRCFE